MEEISVKQRYRSSVAWITCSPSERACGLGRRRLRWNILQRNSQSFSMFLEQRHKKDLAKISLEKDEDESDEEANHNSKPCPNKKSPEMHPIVLYPAIPSVPGSTMKRGVMVQTTSQSRINQSTRLKRKMTPVAQRKISSRLPCAALAERAAATGKPSNPSQKGIPHKRV